MTRSLDNILAFLLIFVVGMILAQFVVGIKLSTVGANLTLLEKEWATLTQENQKLTEELALNTSLKKIASVAERSGLQRPQEILYLTTSHSQAHVSSIEKP